MLTDRDETLDIKDGEGENGWNMNKVINLIIDKLRQIVLVKTLIRIDHSVLKFV